MDPKAMYEAHRDATLARFAALCGRAQAAGIQMHPVGGGHALAVYRDEGVGGWFTADVVDLTLLVSLLDEGDPDAYSRWCGLTEAIEADERDLRDAGILPPLPPRAPVPEWQAWPAPRAEALVERAEHRVVFRVAPEDRGQVIEVSYAGFDSGILCRSLDRSDGAVTYRFRPWRDEAEYDSPEEPGMNYAPR